MSKDTLKMLGFRTRDSAIAQGLWLGRAAVCVGLAGLACSGGPRVSLEASAVGSGGAPNTGKVPQTLSFEPRDALALGPGEVATVRVVATPPDTYPIRFDIVAADPDESNDASLSSGEVQSGIDGYASVELTAPSEPTTFTLRASIATYLTASLGVSVSDVGYGKLRVFPIYTGQREVETWTASVRAGTTCSELIGTPPPDGDLVTTSEAPAPALIENVPIGPALALTLRAGGFAGGCADVIGLAVDETREISVQVKDKPLQVSETDLAVELELSSSTEDWTGSLQRGIDESLAAMFGAETNDVLTLLESMEAELDGDDRDEFVSSSADHDFSAALTAAFGNGSAVRLRAPIVDWLKAGADTLIGKGSLEGRLVSASGGVNQALFELERVGKTPAESAGFATHLLATWSAGTGDQVLLGMRSSWLPSKLSMALAERAAKKAEDADDIVAALAAVTDCKLVGDTLIAAAEPDPVYGNCVTGKCVEKLCESALATLWLVGGQASIDPDELQVSVAADASLDDQARPIGFSGSWIAKLNQAEAVTLSGDANASLPE